MNKERELENKIIALEEQLKDFIPRRRIRRVCKMLGNILDAEVNTTPYVNILVEFINKIEKEGSAVAGQEIKTTI